MNLPPSQPPQSFHYTGNAHLKSGSSLVFFGAALIYFLARLIFGITLGKTISIAFYSFFVLFNLGVVMMSWPMFFNRWGGRIEIREGTIKMLRRNNSTWMGCKFTSILDLSYTMPKGETVPNMYFLKLNKGSIMFTPDVENLDQLVSIIELRTGKKFQKV